VTGAAGGMGLATISLLLKYNVDILALDIQKPNKKLLQNKRVTYRQIDLVNELELTRTIKEFIKKYKRIDYLVNTTGVLWFGKDVSAVDLDLRVWDQVFNINLKTMVLLSKIIIPVMKKNKFGSMVHISSVDALSGDDKPQDAYGASKAAMIRLSKSLAIQFGSFNIRSNCILPGAVETPMQSRWKKIPNAKKKLKEFMPIKKIIQPKGIAEGIIFLLSDQSEYITGTELIIDGGLTARP
jgi:3-oxoacyl-[acyl-carrier protein] reductase